MARLYRHKLKGWQIHYRLHFPDGSSKRKFRYFRNKLLAQDALQDIEKLEHRSLRGTLTREDLLFFLRRKFISNAEATQLGGGAVQIPTLEELKDEFLRKSEVECRPGVHKTNEIRIQHLLDFFDPDTPASKITLEWIEDYRNWRLKSVSPTTVNKEVIKLAQLLDIALAKKAIQENPARKIRRLRDLRERKPRSLTREEITNLLKAAKAEKRLFEGYAYPIIMTYLYTGMRRNELLWLEWEDVDFEKRRITIQAKRERKGFVTKTGKARVVGLSKKLQSVFEQLGKKGRFIFGGDKPLMKPDGVTHAFRRLADKVGLPRSVTLHSLRHTYITHLMEKGINPRRVQELAGHKTFETTWRYSHVLPSKEIEEDLLDF